MNRDYLKHQRHYVYRHFDADGQVLYVGCSYNVEQRFKQQMFESTWWAERVARTQITVHPDRASARAAERSEIRRLEPLHSGDIYWMDTSTWTREKFIAHGRALAEGTYAESTDGRSSVGMLFVAYFKKYQRNLFADMGTVAPGVRISTGRHERPSRQLVFTGHIRSVVTAEVPAA